MGGRYVITGTELGMLSALSMDDGKEIMQKVIDEGYICDDVPKQTIVDIVKAIIDTVKSMIVSEEEAQANQDALQAEAEAEAEAEYDAQCQAAAEADAERDAEIDVRQYEEG